MGCPDELLAFETLRLRLRDWCGVLAGADQRAGLERALTDILVPEVLAPLPPSLQLGAGGVGAWVDGLAAEASVALVEDKHGVLLGLLILGEGPDEDLHLGYLLGNGSWGRGYASELVAGLVEAAAASGTVTCIYGGVARDNPASARVLQKAGFAHDPDLSDTETEMFVWRR